ncbi:calexcitin-2-like [Penaeus japonicus]|uniref:calexcitin-2-like n=1 Tax=Penaeus japonicus TaxID=27405 RepID=UPI001C70C1B0|nr:calexcitin-2-like [Penaeus japonicus]
MTSQRTRRLLTTSMSPARVTFADNKTETFDMRHMSDLSKFRRAKLLHVFTTFFDVNRSGEIDEKDLDIAIQKVCGARGWSQDDPHYEKTRNTLRTLWTVLTSKADIDQDHQVSVEEWYCAWREDESDREWSHIFRDLMFLLEDASGDGHVDVDEYVALYTALGLKEAQCREAFRRIQKDDTSVVTKDKFDALWEQYFHSEDPNAPGNFIFGKFDF